MRFQVSPDLAILSGYLPRFLDLVGSKRLFKRLDQLDADQRQSPFRQQIVADYHWLELAIGFQIDVLTKNGCLLPELVDATDLAALHFAANIVEAHARLTEEGQRTLQGRLRDGLKAETGYAAIYLELDLARQLMTQGYEVDFVDMEGRGRFDLEYGKPGFRAELECKSISADAGREIHRKDFYRFMEAISPALNAHRNLRRREVLVITLRDRLSPNTDEQADLRRAVAQMLGSGATAPLEEVASFRLQRRSYADCLADVPTDDPKLFYNACRRAFGQNTHIAGGFAEDCGCLIVMRSEREDDTSKPVLEAIRKAANQFSRTKPAIIALQFQEVEAADLMLPNLRQRMGVLSRTLFGHYGATHVVAIYFCGFRAILVHDGELGTPAFVVPNAMPRFPIESPNAKPFLLHISDSDYAAMIGEPLPADNISSLPFQADGDP